VVQHVFPDAIHACVLPDASSMNQVYNVSTLWRKPFWCSWGRWFMLLSATHAIVVYDNYHTLSHCHKLLHRRKSALHSNVFLATVCFSVPIFLSTMQPNYTIIFLHSTVKSYQILFKLNPNHLPVVRMTGSE